MKTYKTRKGDFNDDGTPAVKTDIATDKVVEAPAEVSEETDTSPPPPPPKPRRRSRSRKT